MSGAPPSGVKESLRALGADVLALARVRIELLAVELREVTERQKQIVWLAIVSALFLAAGLLAVGVLLVVVFWDTYRVAALVGVCAAYLGVGAWAALRLQDVMGNSAPPFAASIAEFERDVDMLRGPE